MKRTTWIGVLVMVAVIATLAVTLKQSQSSNQNTQTFKIGGAFALTGDIAAYGEADKEGAQLAVEEINAAGGVNGKQIELLVQDTKSTSRDTVSAFQKLKSVDGAKYFMVSFADTYPGTESLVGEDELFISPDAGVEVLNKPVMHKNVFGTWYRTQPKSEMMIRHMAENGVKELYLVVNNDGYYATVVDYTKEAADKYGVTIVGTDLLGTNADVRSVLAKVKASGADAVFFGVLDNSLYVDFIKNYRNFIKNIPLYSDEAATSYLTPEYVSYMEGVYFYANIDAPKKFLETHKTRFGHDAQINASVAYDTVYMMAEAMKDQPKDIDSYMRSRAFNTISYGKVTFDKLGGIQTDAKYFVMKQVQKGAPVTVFQ